MTSAPHTSSRLALISMPWALFNRPSIQLGSLKAFVEQHSALTVDLFHPYLNVAKQLGPELYHQLALSGWAGEALFAPLLFPDQYDQARRLFSNTLPRHFRMQADYDKIISDIAASCAYLAEQLAAQPFIAVGFSVCFNQLLGSLYLAKLLQGIRPATPIVFGGTSCCGQAGISLLKTFDQIDFLIDGEGELPLLALCRHLIGEKQSLPAAVRSKKNVQTEQTTEHIKDLNTLPIPDYRSYLDEVKRTFADNTFIPVLPVEFSRGCWWNKCTFCNLNLQWPSYRHKNHQRMAKEVETLTNRHESLDFVFTDNALPAKEADSFFTQQALRGVAHRFFAEIRPLSEPQRLATYRRGGLETVQIGIEALSSSLLVKMGKGTTAMDNITAMKLGCAAGIKVEGNLIIEFPTTSPEEIAETLAALDYVLPYRPLQIARFFLGYGSPISKLPQAYTIRAVTVHPNNKQLFPENLHDNLTLMAQGYRGDRKKQRQMWQPVRTKIKAWQVFHANRRQTRPALSYRDGGEFLIIRQELTDGSSLHHRLRGLSRRIYLRCATPQSLNSLTTVFSPLPFAKLDAFCQELERKKLLFREKDQVLALAIDQAALNGHTRVP